jgi:hypothetical protein
MGGGRRAAVFFHYFEADETYRDNLVFFLAVAHRTDADFFVILAGECTVDLPDLPNVTYVEVENRDHDYGGYVAALADPRRREGYDLFVFVNSSVRGPFLPVAHRGSWLDLFARGLADGVHLVGSSITIPPPDPYYPLAEKARRTYGFEGPLSHVQTTAYALSGEALRRLVDRGFYDREPSPTKGDLVCKYELGLTQEILAKGWRVRCFLPEYNAIDYARPHDDVNFSSATGDPLFRGAFFGRTLHPRELVFIKTNRNLLSESELASHTFCALAAAGEPSWGPWEEATRLRDRARAKAAPLPGPDPSFLRRAYLRTRRRLAARLG